MLESENRIMRLAGISHVDQAFLQFLIPMGALSEMLKDNISALLPEDKSRGVYFAEFSVSRSGSRCLGQFNEEAFDRLRCRIVLDSINLLLEV